jgi:hypothetical protein
MFDGQCDGDQSSQKNLIGIAMNSPLAESVCWNYFFPTIPPTEQAVDAATPRRRRVGR